MAKRGVCFGGDQGNIPAGVSATGGCCYGDQCAEIRLGLYLAESCRSPGASGVADEYDARASKQEHTCRSGW